MMAVRDPTPREQRMEAEAARDWKARLAQDRELAEPQLRVARAARIMAATWDHGTEAYIRAESAYWKAQDEVNAVLQRRLEKRRELEAQGRPAPLTPPKGPGKLSDEMLTLCSLFDNNQDMRAELRAQMQAHADAGELGGDPNWWSARYGVKL